MLEISVEFLFKKTHQYILSIYKHFKYKKYNFVDVVLGDVEIIGSYVSIGKGTYMNSGRISNSEQGKVKIGVWCAIGYNVHILAHSHDVYYPTTDTNSKSEEADINIGNGVWIGTNAVILKGVTIGDYAVIGANAVVTKDVGDFEVVGGVPATLLYKKDKDKCIDHIRFITSELDSIKKPLT